MPLLFFHTRAEALGAINELEQSSFQSEDFNVFEGEQGTAALDLEGSHHTLLNGYMRKFVKFSDAAEWHFLTEAEREIRSGHILLFVAAPTKEEKELVITAFKNQGAFGIRYFSAIAIEDVV